MVGTYRNLDLHLLTTLDHLLRERSVTGAARRLGVSQPAVSSSLAKLRRHFDDELLVRHGTRYVLTPLATGLAARTPAALAEMRSLFDLADAFDPATTTRRFDLVTSDYLTTVHGAAIAARVASEAPSAVLRFLPIASSTLTEFDGQLLGVDGLVLPRASIPDYPYVDLVPDEWVLVGSATGAHAATPLTEEVLRGAAWVAFRLQQGGHIPPVESLHGRGIETRTEIVTGDLVSVPFLVAGTDRLGFVPRALAELMADAAGTVVLDSPVPLPPLTMTMLWHPAKELDAGHAWLRGVLATLAP